MTLPKETLYALLSLDLDTDTRHELANLMLSSPEGYEEVVKRIDELFIVDHGSPPAQAITEFNADADVAKWWQRLLAEEQKVIKEIRRYTLKGVDFLEMKQRRERLEAEVTQISKTMEEMIALGLNGTQNSGLTPPSEKSD